MNTDNTYRIDRNKDRNGTTLNPTVTQILGELAIDSN